MPDSIPLPPPAAEQQAREDCTSLRVFPKPHVLGVVRTHLGLREDISVSDLFVHAYRRYNGVCQDTILQEFVTQRIEREVESFDRTYDVPYYIASFYYAFLRGKT